MKQKQILFITLSNIGDVVLTTPVLANLYHLFPGSFITVVAGPKAESLLKGSSQISRLILYDKKSPWPEKFRMIRRLRNKTYDLVVDVRNTLIPYLVKVRRRTPLVRKYRHRSMRKRHLEVLSWVGIDPDENGRGFDFFSAEDLNAVEGLRKEKGISGRPYFLIAAGAASERKRWPLSNYENVIRKLAFEESSSLIFLIGDSQERSYMELLCRAVPERVHNLAGELTLRQSAALIQGCKLLLTNDSAAMHLGHELKRNVVAVFGPTDWRKYGREGERFRMVHPDRVPGTVAEKNTEPFAGVSEEQVWEACAALLEKNREEVS